MKAILTRRANGLYLLTRWMPVIANVGPTERKDAWPQPGDPLSVNNLCEWSARFVWGVENLPVCESVQVWVEGGRVEKAD